MSVNLFVQDLGPSCGVLFTGRHGK